ncbi:SETMR methyltransferase, partial [Acromyrmex heyeri]
ACLMFSDTMKKEQYRAVILFLFLDGETCEEIKTKLDAVYGNSSPSMTTIRYWFNEFKRSRSSVFDEKRPSRPADVQSIVELRYELLPHPPHSPDLAPCNFFLFPNLKKWLDGKKFTANEEVIVETEAYFT